MPVELRPLPNGQGGAMKQALARGFISKEKSELVKVIEKGVKGTESLTLQGGDG